MENDKADEPMFEKNGFKWPRALRGFIESPPLLEGENPEDFLSLLQAIVEDEKPQGILEWISAFDMAVKYSEEFRLRQFSAALIPGGMFKALNYYLNRIRPPEPNPLDLPYSRNNDFDDALALDYYSADQEEKERTRAELAQHGITLAVLQATAAELNAKPLQMFGGMIAACENGRRKLRKEAARRKSDRNDGDFNGSRSDGNPKANRGKPRKRKA